MSQCNQCCRTPCECMDGGETERDAAANADPGAIVITKPCETCAGNGRPVTFWNGVVDCADCAGTGRVPDVEATLRTENATLKESLERALVCLYGAGATLDDARKVPTMVNVELDKRNAEIARLTAEVDRMMRETARLIGEVERLTAREREAETLFQEMGIKFTDWTRVNTWLAGCKS